MRPTFPIADLCRGVLARAARLYPVRIHAFTFLGNHYHLLLTAPSSQRLAGFMNYLNSNLAREIGRTVGWRERFWGRRYQAILVSDEEPAQVERLLYILRHGCKENLVRRPTDWPGATAIRNLLTGAPVTGSWLDRSALYEASRKGHFVERRQFLTTESFELDPLPCWSHLDSKSYRRRMAELIRRIERETAARILESARVPLGSRQIQRQDPHQSPTRIRKSPAPLVHAASKSARDALKEAYRLFVNAFRHASKQLRGGRVIPEILELFPLGSFPPPSPFIPLPGTATG